VKAAALVLAVLLVLSGAHVPLRLAGYPVSVPVPVVALAAELAACAVLGWLISRAARGCPIPSPLFWRTT
jgi:hypothetical protein